MRGKWSPFRLPPRWRWTMWPFIGLAGGGSAVGLALQWEEAPFAECLPLAALPGLYAGVYWFYRSVFKATSPCRKDLDNVVGYNAHSDSKRS